MPLRVVPRPLRAELLEHGVGEGIPATELLCGRRIYLELLGVSRRSAGKEILSNLLGPGRDCDQPLALFFLPPHDELSAIDANLAFLALPLEWRRAEAAGSRLQRDLIVALARRRDQLLGDAWSASARGRESFDQWPEWL